MTVTLHQPDRRCRDLDISMKSLLDALEYGGVYADDSQIDRLGIKRGTPTPGSCCIVEIVEEH